MTPRPSAVLAIRAPLATPGLKYRAYEENWGNGTVLDWILRRIRAAAPVGVPVVCVCEGAGELERLTAARCLADEIEVLHFRARGERHLCRQLMDKFNVSRLMLAGFSHATAPPEMMRHVMLIHGALTAELSDVTGATFWEPLYVIESTLIDEMGAVMLPDVPQAVIPAAQVLGAAHARDGRLVRDFLWTRIDVSKRFGLSPDQWPEQIAIRRPEDIAMLRQAAGELVPTEPAGYIAAWKRAAIARPRGSFPSAHPTPTVGSRTRILYASHLPGFTGAHQSICHLVGALDRRRYDPVALVSYEGTFTQELRQRGIPVICPERDITAPGIDSFRHALQVFADQRPQILHAQHSVGMGVICAAAALGVPIIQHVRVPNVSSLRHYLHAADAIIAVSSYIRGRLTAMDIDPAKIEVVLNGVDPTLFSPEPGARIPSRLRFGIPSDEFAVLIVARMTRKKRHDVVIKAVARLRQAMGLGHLVLVGTRDKDLAHQHGVHELIDSEGLSEHVTQMEFIADIRPVLHACDVLALVSEEEPLSRAVLDAMAVGLPSIVSDSGGSQEVVDHGHTGMVVPHGDERSLADALITLARNDVLRQALGAAAVRKIRSSLTADLCASKTSLIYDRLLRGEYRHRHASAVAGIVVQPVSRQHYTS